MPGVHLNRRKVFGAMKFDMPDEIFQAAGPVVVGLQAGLFMLASALHQISRHQLCCKSLLPPFSLG